MHSPRQTEPVREQRPSRAAPHALNTASKNAVVPSSSAESSATRSPDPEGRGFPTALARPRSRGLASIATVLAANTTASAVCQPASGAISSVAPRDAKKWAGLEVYTACRAADPACSRNSLNADVSSSARYGPAK